MSPKAIGRFAARLIHASGGTPEAIRRFAARLIHAFGDVAEGDQTLCRAADSRLRRSRRRRSDATPP